MKYWPDAVPEVWSIIGPVPVESVKPLVRVKSKSSSVKSSHIHKLHSKLHLQIDVK